MKPERLQAFSDGVIAILITIMVLELKVPHGDDWEALRPLAPVFCTYVLSFVYVGIYWNNHHHMFQVVRRVNGGILLANLHLLFWLSLIPFATGWMGENHFAPLPTALYGVVLLASGVSYTLLQTVILADRHAGETLAEAVGGDVKGKLSMVAYAAAIPLAFVSTGASTAIYVLVALAWLVPDRRIESRVG